MPGEEVPYKQTTVNFSSHLDGQHGGCDITEENVGGGTKNQKLTKIVKKICKRLISNGITITNKFRPTNQNKLVNQESRSKVDTSEWMLHKIASQNACFKIETAEIDLFHSQVSHQPSKYEAQNPDPFSIATDALSVL